MSSEAITRNDLREIMNKVLPVAKDWVLLGTSSGGNAVTYSDVEQAGYTELYIQNAQYQGGYVLVKCLPTTVLWGAYYFSSFGAIRQVSVTKTKMTPQIAYTDSNNVMSNTSWKVYAR